MEKIIKNWVHIPGLHCGSVALRDVITYYGYNLSEAMCFGLGGGLGFFYIKGENMSPSKIIHLRGPGMEPNFFSLIDKPTSWKYEPNEEKAFEIAKEWINEELPSWAEALDWRWCVRFAYQVIEKRGTGGGGFRWLYRDFLREAEEIIPALKEFKLSEKMDLIGNNWSEMSTLLKEISESEKNSNLFIKASEKAKELGDLEEEFYKVVLDKIL